MEVSHFKTLRTRPDIIMFGDSITASAEWSELFPSASIINRGISKDTTKGLLERVNEVADRKPKAVFILIGINDIGKGECVDVIFTNYKKLIVYFEERGIKTLIQSTIYPGRTINSLQHQKVLQLNQRLLSFTRGKSMSSFIDLNQVLAPEGFLRDDYTVDGIHLNGLGYEEWARYITSDILSVKGLEN
jgi:lysophospholipase L1-like esterase